MSPCRWKRATRVNKSAKFYGNNLKEAKLLITSTVIRCGMVPKIGSPDRARSEQEGKDAEGRLEDGPTQSSDA